MLEPVLDLSQIQGNILVGFNKDHQAILTFVMPAGAAGRAGVRSWLTEVEPTVTFSDPIERERRTRRAMRMMKRTSEPVGEVYVAIALSFAGLTKARDDAGGFTDPKFRSGLDAARSSDLGDPTAGRGAPQHWRVGGAAGLPDGILILASDDAEFLETRVAEERQRLTRLGGRILSDDVGHDLAYYSDEEHQWPRGLEHFGFKDGVGRPGVRGRVEWDGTTSFLTPRTMPEPDDMFEIAYASPGRPLVSPGAFILGYPRQNPAIPGLPLAPLPLGSTVGDEAPTWARNGSFLVFRRLAQDVGLFNRFLEAESARIGQAEPSLAGLDPVRLGAMLVGRWRSGAPISRFPDADPRPPSAAAEPDDAFLFAAALDPGDGFPPSVPDVQGLVCPAAAHIRKVNPRDTSTDQGSAPNTLVRRMLRRGIPYGRPLPIGSIDDDGAERGLLFVAYVSSIEAQFEFLQTHWVNDPRNPAAGDAGIDMIIGQNSRDPTRARKACLRGEQVEVRSAAVADAEWVFPTGGGYFFAPSKDAIRHLASGST